MSKSKHSTKPKSKNIIAEKNYPKRKEMTVVTEYLEYHEKYAKEYNNRSLVLMQVGQFYEMYATNERGPDLNAIFKITDLKIAKKGGSEKPVSESDPYMLGFQMFSFMKFVPKLLDNNYTVIVIDQISDPPNCKRDVTGIYSPGININSVNANANYIGCIYIESVNQRIGEPLLCSGMTAIDVTTGKVIVHEMLSSREDENIALDETVRFLASINPKELILICDDMNVKSEHIIKYFNLDKRNLHIVTSLDQKYQKLNYQTEILKNVYKNYDQMVDPVEFVNMERNQYSIISLVYLCNFIFNHNEKLINDLQIPEFFMDNDHLILGNNAVYQLNVIESDSYNYNATSKYKSLIDVIDNTSTAIGARFLKARLLSPLTNRKKIEENYKHITIVMEMKSKYMSKLENSLDNIYDVEKLCRRMCLDLLHPYEMIHLIQSYERMKEIVNIFERIKKERIFKPALKAITKIERFIKEFDEIFDREKMTYLATPDILNSIFKKGIYPDVDALQQSLDDASAYSDNLCTGLMEMMKFSAKTKPLAIKRDKNKGYYVSLTKARADNLNNLFKTKKSITIDDVEISTTDFKFEGQTLNTVKLFLPSIAETDRNDIDEKIAKLCKKYYAENISAMYQKYANSFNIVNNFIAYIDFIKSGAKTAKKFNYVRPSFVENDFGYVNIKDMRHPIVERIIDYEYVPHDVELGDKLKGMLIYGLNSSGKSIFQKAVGLSVILAQSGYFVPAKEFAYTPFKSLYARITGNDNLFRNLSSFSLEMVELNAILKRSGRFTLTIGDEVCRGTEHISGNAIVASTICMLAKSESSFIFATHLHELVNLKRIKDIQHVKAFHLSVKKDEENKALIFERKLQNGPGEPVYGVLVASHIIQNQEFIGIANDIKNELMESHSEIVSGKISKYNSNVFVHKCQLCGRPDLNGEFSPLQTHHINFQKDCKDGFVKNKGHIAKNSSANLIVVCETCHNKIHNNELTVTGTIKTSRGKEFKKN